MKDETLIKYLDFLKTECLRHQKDEIITDDEINQLEVEIKGFKSRLQESSFSDEIKYQILRVDFNINDESHNHSKLKWLNFIGGFQGREIKDQVNRKHRFEKLYNDLDAALFKIKTIL